MRNSLLITFGKTVSKIAKAVNLGNGSTWPGHIALQSNPHFIRDMIENNKLQTIAVAGTNGKTTTSLLIKKILQKDGMRTIHNGSGANLLNGIASTLLLSANTQGKINANFAIFEVDENSLPLLLKEMTPDYLLVLNLFRDQLDRYGEVNTIALKWHTALKKLSDKTTLLLNADDPQIAYLAKHAEAKVYYFGMNDTKQGKTKQEHAVDSTYCPHCGKKLSYETIYYSHLGDWLCPNCGVKRPQLDGDTSPFYPLLGTYNTYNTNAAVLLAHKLQIKNDVITDALKEFSPAFGRQERIKIHGKNVQVFLAKNPTGFNECLRTIRSVHAKQLLLILNDRIPDGRDVSWIWDVDFEEFLSDFTTITISGDRCFDMGLRIKYARTAFPDAIGTLQIEPNLDKAIHQSLDHLPKDETLYVLPTYSAMLEIRKILHGRKIL